MRQAGILAAAGLYAFEHRVTRLRDDHHHARKLAQLLHQIPAIHIVPQHVETNIVIFDVIDPRWSPPTLVAALKAAGVLVNPIGGQSFRAVTHLNVSMKDIEEAGAIFARVLSGSPSH